MPRPKNFVSSCRDRASRWHSAWPSRVLNILLGSEPDEGASPSPRAELPSLRPALQRGAAFARESLDAWSSLLIFSPLLPFRSCTFPAFQSRKRKHLPAGDAIQVAECLFT
jgi:hypothetical protein